MTDLPIPADPQALTADWLTAALQRAGVLEADANVLEARVTVIGADRGIGGQVARVLPEYDRATNAPSSLIAKFPSAVETTRGGGRFLRLPEREVRLYLDVAPVLGLRVPRCYHAAVADDGDAFVILMEDLGTAQPGDDLEGVSDEHLLAAVRGLATLHSTWWRSPLLDALEWMPAIDERAATWQRLFALAWREVRDIDEIAGALPEGIDPVAELLSRRGAEVYTRLAAWPPTLLHGDFRLDNLFFDLPDGSPLGVIDWSNAMRGPAPYDLAYLLAVALSPERRRALEPSLLATYLEGLRAGGVPASDLDGCEDAYRLSFLEPFMRMLFLVTRGHAEGGGQRAHRVLSQIMERSAAAALDLDAVSLLEG